MKRVLFLAYYFPPDGGAGSLRALKMVRYLPEFGWEPVVLAPEPEHDVQDPTLVEELGDARVVRVPGIQPLRWWRDRRASRGEAGGPETAPAAGTGRALRRWVRRILFFPDEAVYWTASAVSRGTKLSQSARPDVVLATQPNSLLLAATILSRRLGVPCVTDFRDEWARGGPSDDRPWIRRQLEAPLERCVVSGSAAVVCNTPGMRSGFAERYPDAGARLTHIPNGYDAEDFPPDAPCRSAAAPKAAGTQGPLEIVYAGALYAEYNPLAFLRGAARAIRETDLTPDNLRLVFYGRHDASVAARMRELSRREGLADVLFCPGQVPHGEAVESLCRADLLLLLLPSGGSAASRITAKTYEVLAAGRPVLAMLPAGDARQLVEASGAAFSVLDPGDEQGVASALCGAVRAKAGGTLRARTDWSVVRRYERRRLAAELAEVLDCVSGDAV